MKPPSPPPGAGAFAMRSGEVYRIDFGSPLGSEAGLVRPAVVITDDNILESISTTFQVIPFTSTVRNWPTDVSSEWVKLRSISSRPCRRKGPESISVPWARRNSVHFERSCPTFSASLDFDAGSDTTARLAVASPMSSLA